MTSCRLLHIYVQEAYLRFLVRLQDLPCDAPHTREMLLRARGAAALGASTANVEAHLTNCNDVAVSFNNSRPISGPMPKLFRGTTAPRQALPQVYPLYANTLH